jgi:hypothetical protein
MLALIATRVPQPAEESAVRDPGFLTLAIAVVRAVRVQAAVAFARHCELLAETGGRVPF